MSKTIFERIAAKEIPANLVYEDEQVVAFRDINPQAPVHILIVPRRAIPRVDEATAGDQSLLGHVLLKAAEVAKKAGLRAPTMMSSTKTRKTRTTTRRPKPARPTAS